MGACHGLCAGAVRRVQQRSPECSEARRPGDRESITREQLRVLGQVEVRLGCVQGLLDERRVARPLELTNRAIDSLPERTPRRFERFTREAERVLRRRPYRAHRPIAIGCDQGLEQEPELQREPTLPLRPELPDQRRRLADPRTKKRVEFLAHAVSFRREHHAVEVRFEPVRRSPGEQGVEPERAVRRDAPQRTDPRLVGDVPGDPSDARSQRRVDRIGEQERREARPREVRIDGCERTGAPEALPQLVGLPDAVDLAVADEAPRQVVGDLGLLPAEQHDHPRRVVGRWGQGAP